VPILRGNHRRGADSRHLTQGPGVVVHGVPDGLGDHHLNPHLPTGYLTDLTAAVEEVERLRWTLAQVIAVADDAVRAQADVAPESRAARTLAYQAVCRPAIRRR
jgi:hypothetical protein